MKVLFIGGTGVISSAVSELAVRSGIELYLLNRGTNNEVVIEGANIITGDIRDVEKVTEALKGYSFDVVVDWVAFKPEHVEADINLFKGKTGQYIFISSASAYHKPVNYHLINESTPLYNPFWQYSRDKIACEERLMKEYREEGFPVTVVRPSYTYNRNMIPFALNSRKYRWTIIDRMLKGKKVIIPGDGTTFYTLTHARDFAKGFVGLLGNIQAIGHAFHITSDEALTWDQVLHIIGREAGVEPKISHIPSEFIGAFSEEYYGSLLGDKAMCAIFDNSKIKRFVPGFNATVPFHQGIRECFEYYRARPEICRADEEFDLLCDKIIAAYEKGLAMAKS